MKLEPPPFEVKFESRYDRGVCRWLGFYRPGRLVTLGWSAAPRAGVCSALVEGLRVWVGLVGKRGDGLKPRALLETMAFL